MLHPRDDQRVCEHRNADLQNVSLLFKQWSVNLTRFFFIVISLIWVRLAQRTYVGHDKGNKIENSIIRRVQMCLCQSETSEDWTFGAQRLWQFFVMLVISQLEASWNVMAHAQKPDFVFRRNGRVHLNRRGHHFSRLLAAEVCASAVVMLDTSCSEVVWRVLATHSIRQFPLHFPSRLSPYAITFQLDSASVGRCINIIWSTDVAYKQQHFREQHKLSAITGLVFTDMRNFRFFIQQTPNPKTVTVTIKLLGTYRHGWQDCPCMYKRNIEARSRNIFAEEKQ